MRVADVLRRQMERVEDVYEITLDEGSVAPGLVLADHVSEECGISVPDLDGSSLPDDEPYLATARHCGPMLPVTTVGCVGIGHQVVVVGVVWYGYAPTVATWRRGCEHARILGK